MQISSGKELYERAVSLVSKPEVTYQELEKAFHDFNILLDGAISEDDEKIETLLFHIGTVAMKKGERGLALLLFREALQIRPKFLEAINNIGYIYKKFNKGDKAQDSFQEVVDLVESGEVTTTDENKSEFYTNLGSMFVAQGIPDKAIEIFDKAEVLSPHHKMNRYNRGLCYLEKGDYEKGFEGYESSDRLEKIQQRNYGHDSLPVWDGTPNKNIVVIGEQGIGDELMFGTIIEDVMRDCNIIIDAHPRLADMFRRSFPNVDVYGTRKDPFIDWGRRYKLDAKILIGSLASLYRKKEDDFPRKPYLVVNNKYNERYKNRLNDMGDKPKIGISWRGGTKMTNRSDRFIPLNLWIDILKMDFTFISLQYDPGITTDIEKFNEEYGVKLHHWSECMEDYEQTLALVNNLDLVLSVPQSVVHLAGAVGKLTLQLCPFKSMWQSGPFGQDMPWYESVSNIWQQSDNDWVPVMNEVKEVLCSLLQTTTEN